jgi:hypothetical protein
MIQPHGEVVRIASSTARITRVTRQRVDYVDMAGQVQFIDLEECVANWNSWHDSHRGEFLPLPGSSPETTAAWNARCVGLRGALDNPPWAEFMNERKTRFEFVSYAALYAELLTPLKKAGWHTFDTD